MLRIFMRILFPVVAKGIVAQLPADADGFASEEPLQTGCTQQD
jgi:hypothetical protein